MNARRVGAGGVTVAALVLLGGACASDGGQPISTAPSASSSVRMHVSTSLDSDAELVRIEQASVVRVVHGTSLEVASGGPNGLRVVRLAGLRVPSDDRAACARHRAIRLMRQLLPAGTPVGLTANAGRAATPGGAAIRYVSTADRDAGSILLERGAVVFDRSSISAAGLASVYRQAQREARLHGRGIWGEC